MIYKRGKVFWIKYYSGGKPIRESTGTSKQKQAERLLKDREGRVAIGAPALPQLERVSRLQKNSIYMQNAVGLFHMAPMSQQVQDAQKGRPARPQ